MRWVIFMCLCGLAFATTSESTVKLKQVLHPILKGHKPGEGHLNVHGCGVPLSKIVQFLVFGSPFTYTFQFSVDCDVQGTIQFQPGTFPIDAAIKNLGSFTHLTALGELAITHDNEYEIVLQPRLTNGKLSVKNEAEPLDFAAQYRVAFRDITHLGTPVNQGGKIEVKRFEGKSAHFVGDLWLD